MKEKKVLTCGPDHENQRGRPAPHSGTRQTRTEERSIEQRASKEQVELRKAQISCKTVRKSFRGHPSAHRQPRAEAASSKQQRRAEVSSSCQQRRTAASTTEFQQRAAETNSNMNGFKLLNSTRTSLPDAKSRPSPKAEWDVSFFRLGKKLRKTETVSPTRVGHSAVRQHCLCFSTMQFGEPSAIHTNVIIERRAFSFTLATHQADLAPCS